MNIFKKLLFFSIKRALLYVDNCEWNIDKKKLKAIGTNSRIMSPYTIYNHNYISIGNNFSSLKNTRLEAFDNYYGAVFSPQIRIGDNVSMNSDCHIGCIKEVLIGNNVLIASRVYISDHTHGNVDGTDIGIPPYLRPLSSKGSVVIENNVWIGEGVCILPGVTIGENSIIGANSVVNKSIPSNCVAAGVPARIIKIL